MPFDDSSFQRALDVGDEVPAWSMPDADGSTVRSGAYVGRLVLLVFLSGDPTADAALAAQLDALDERFAAADTAVAYIVSGEEESFWAATRTLGDAVLCHDAHGALARAFRAEARDETAHASAFLIDRAGRIAAASRHAGREGEPQRMVEACSRLRQSYGPSAAASMQAPVLVVPRVLSPDECASLLAIYERGPHAPSPVSDTVGGRAALVLDPSLKVRRDAVLTVDDGRRFERQILLRLQAEVQKCFSFTVTHYEGFKIGCYEASTRGFFGPHRDNKNERNAHWRFAMSLNLNEDYEGGCLRFPEFSDALFKPEPGAAIVFSCSLLHEATAVTAGRRLVLLTFLYAKDDAARAQRLNGFGGYPVPMTTREPVHPPQKHARRR